ncbi:integral membrane protein [Saccharata proteae CBS 121410]|uniref:Integral membrane protein n=1 Tax=Saccharata proteae CBS 121410 TaxID=1314787 RepID=A0A9P4HW78_9PEZI|nr:integral membrane protein [Saccharata proteae CBS 121410]
MGAGAFIEPLVVVTLLFGGTWVNRNTEYRIFGARQPSRTRSHARSDSPDSLESGFEEPSQVDNLLGHRSSSPSLLTPQDSKWRKREVSLLGFSGTVTSPNTRVFKDRFLSRLLQKFPFLVEAWYWALIYWVYQLGRAFTAVTLVEGTVHVARKHALQLIHIEQKLHLFFELDIQHFFLRHPFLMTWINRIYSFIHIPGTILFLVWLFYYTTTRNRLDERQSGKNYGEVDGSPAGPRLYEARRRTMAVCNLLAFVVFTLWPCMPPRLLSDKTVTGPTGEEARSYGFVDTVHGVGGEGSVWTENRFCNQYAAMPSLHFGYSLLIGLTIAMIPLSPQHSRRQHTISLPLPFLRRLRLPSVRRLACLVIGIAYPLTILIAIIATANHFILDAVAGAIVCGLAWNGNRVLLNLLWIEDWFLWALRLHKPERRVVDWVEGGVDGEAWVGKGVME